jgi:ABC-type phosphate/phosphonate transport system substrate-binding protein
MIAALPMYDLPEARAITDAWWSILCRHFRAAGLDTMPDTLTRTANVTDSWTMPGLLFTQTCGYPFTHDWSGKLRLVATPRYAAAGCEGSNYRSVFIVSEDLAADDIADLRGTRVAFNATHSQSGFNAPRASIAPLASDGQFFAEAIQSGGHRQSMALVRQGDADVCAIDCVTWEMHRRHAPGETQGLRVLGWTEDAPNLPYVTAIDRDDDTVHRLRDGLSAAIADPAGRDAREALFLDAVEILEPAAYEAIDRMERRAFELGYDKLN